MSPAFRASTAAIALLCLSIAPLPSRAEEIAAPSLVTGATLYPAGATVKRAIRFSAPAGRHDIVIEDLPLEIEADSLRVEGAAETGFTILGLDHRVERPGLEPLTDAARDALEARIRELEWQVRAASDRRQAAADRIAYMQAFREATLKGGGAEGETAALISTVGNWGEAWAQMSAEIAAATEAAQQADREIETLGERIEALRRELDRAGPPPPARGVAMISIDAPAPIADGALTLSYLTRRASWAPLYDLRLEPMDEDAEPGLRRLRVMRRAAIRQQTGEDWSDVALSLSTARPSGRLGAVKPPIRHAMLTTPGAVGGVLDMLSSDEAEDSGEGRYSRNVLAAQQALEAPAEPEAAAESAALAAYDGATVVYTIAERTRAPGDGSVRQVLIGEDAVDVSLLVRATPAVDESAYLYLAYKNGAAPLLPGRASVYRDGAYFGQFNLEYVAPGDQSALPFGRYESVVVDHRIRNRSQGEEGLFTTSNRERLRFALSARNLSDEPVTVTLFDSLPFTETEEIRIAFVGAEPPTERDIDGRRGALAWTFELDAGAEKAIEFGYDMSWPEGKMVQLR